MKRRPTAVIPFPLPHSGHGNGDEADPRWQRVNALYRELVTLDPNFKVRLAQRFEQALRSTIPALLATWNADDRATMMTLAKRMLHHQIERMRLDGLEHIAAGNANYLDHSFATGPTASEELDDLVIKLQRDVDDRLRNLHRQKGGA